MTGWVSKIRTVSALGITNVARAGGYRLGVKLGLNPVRRLKATAPQGPFFHPVKDLDNVVVPAVLDWKTTVLLFSRWPFPLSDTPPDWLANPFNGQRVKAPERDWWQIPDFDPDVGDIKLVWELSRFDWVLAFAQRARHGDTESLSRLNIWITDWCIHNPPYQGPNWKCGQEASIRVMHLAIAAVILGQVRDAESSLLDLVHLHLKRIVPTLQYAIAQENNHGTSEAAALFIGGSWLAALGHAEGASWANIGRRLLENRAARLIGLQGSFSQYSLNYHRVMLDTFSVTEVWRRHLGLTGFSVGWQSRALAATEWLRHMINAINGDGPNVGANDGARLLQLSDTSYRDHRPSVHLAMALFAGQRAYQTVGIWDDSLCWLGVVATSDVAPPPGNYVADDGGFAMLRRGSAIAMLRYPRFRFRPSQADALHLDLWLGADNLLRDGGTYSYNTDQQWLDYFGGTASHNTVQFDDRDQMPRLSRFLLGDWLKTECLYPLKEDGKATEFGAGYRDSQGARHNRRVSLEDTRLQVTDEVKGFASRAVLRWRLKPGGWLLSHSSKGVSLTLCEEKQLMLIVEADVPIERCELVQGWESRHYLEKTPLPVLEVEIRQAGTLKTRLHWAS